MNMVEASVMEGVLILADGQTVSLRSNLPSVLPQKVILGLRPEHLSIASAPVAGAVAAQVLTCETTGAMSYLTVGVAGSKITVTAQTRLELPEGQKVWLTTAPEHVHTFDAATGLRIFD
jgi:multiple sugar transport system ATP-binding protein